MKKEEAMKKANPPLRTYEKILAANNIHQPVKKNKTLFKKFSQRTNRTAQIDEIINATLLLTALRQSAWETKKEASG